MDCTDINYGYGNYFVQCHNNWYGVHDHSHDSTDKGDEDHSKEGVFSGVHGLAVYDGMNNT